MKPPIWSTLFYTGMIAVNAAFLWLDHSLWFNAAVGGFGVGLIFCNWVEWWFSGRLTLPWED